ncbi:MAG TPA: hypothetical protein PLS50_05300, partial [Candidatus Dojkabacteria bacterium]|nr:hypothetical protein [Candidatus Dojkabacteria bacterium]
MISNQLKSKHDLQTPNAVVRQNNIFQGTTDIRPQWSFNIESAITLEETAIRIDRLADIVLNYPAAFFIDNSRQMSEDIVRSYVKEDQTIEQEIPS